jgi:phenylpyruvate tautomerase PptA (4-oxalocrotonate tautomerase family)
MPFYDVYHCIPLSPSQKSALAQKITHLHSRKFTTPSLFVNVAYHDWSKEIIYVGGKPRTFNAVFARVRTGGNRKQEHFEEVCEEVTQAWDEVVNGGRKGVGMSELRGVFIQGVLTAGVEAGFRLPKVGTLLVVSSVFVQGGRWGSFG